MSNEVVNYFENYREEDRLTTNNARRIEFLTTIRKFDGINKSPKEWWLAYYRLHSKIIP